MYLLGVSFLIFWKGNLLFFGKLKKFQIGLVNYLNMLAFLDMKPSLAGIFSALWHIVAEIPTIIGRLIRDDGRFECRPCIKSRGLFSKPSQLVSLIDSSAFHEGFIVQIGKNFFGYR